MPNFESYADMARQLEELTQVLAVLIARQGGELHLTHDDLEKVGDRAYRVEITRDETYQRTTLKAVRNG